MASWEDFSRILVEAKESKKLDPVGQEDDDVNNDGKVDDTDSYLKKRRASVGAAIAADKKKKVEESKKLDPVGEEDKDIDNDGDHDKTDKYLLNRRKVRSKIIQSKVTEDCGCEDSDEKENNTIKEIDPREMKTKVNLAKTKLRMLGLKMSYEPEGGEIVEFLGTGRVVAGQSQTGANPAGGSRFTRAGTVQKVFGMKVPGSFKPGASQSDVQRHNQKASPNTQIKSTNQSNDQLMGRKPGGQTTVGITPDKKPTPTPTAAAKPATKPQGSPSDRAVQGLRSAASSGQMGGTLQTLSNRRAAIDTALQKNSYQPEGEIVEGKKKDSSYLETDMKKRRENNEKAVEDMKKTKGYSDMVKSARKAMGVDEEFVGEDKEYRREMAKAAARERAEEKRSDNEWRKTKPGEKKSLKLSTTPHTKSVVKDYVDQEMGKIKYMDKVTKKNKNVVGLVTKEENEIEEGMTMKDFKSNRKKNERKEASADAEKRGHVGKEWHNTGRKYSTDEAKSRRSNMSDDDRRNRYGSSEDPDSEDYSTYSADKTKDPKKQRKQTAMGEETIQEKALSGAQQRFMGMVYAAKKGETPASPEVAKAAEGMSKKAAKDFAKTKHEGLPEKKEETKEEFSLVDMMIAQFSPLNEAPENTIPGGKRRKGLSKTIQSRQVDKLADEGDYERADKLQDVSSVKLKKNKPQPTASKSPESKPEKKQESGPKKETAGKSTATERAARTTAASRIRAARIVRETEKEKRAYKEKIRQEKKSEQQAKSEDRRKSAEEKQQKLKEIEKGKRADSAERTAQREYDKKQAKKGQLRKQIGAAINVKGPDVVSSKESDAKAVRADVQSAGQLLGAGAKLVGVAVNKMAEKRREKQREKAGKEAREKSLKDDSQNESFVNWREEFILEVDDQVVNPDQKKIIDVSKKKNNIEINPKIDEAAPLIPMVAKLAGGMTSRAVGSKLAGTAAKGSLRSKAAEFAANKAGNLATDVVRDRMEKKFKNEPSSSGTGILDMLSKLGTGQNEEFVNEAGAAWTKKSGKLQAAD